MYCVVKIRLPELLVEVVGREIRVVVGDHDDVFGRVGTKLAGDHVEVGDDDPQGVAAVYRGRQVRVLGEVAVCRALPGAQRRGYADPVRAKRAVVGLGKRLRDLAARHFTSVGVCVSTTKTREYTNAHLHTFTCTRVSYLQTRECEQVLYLVDCY